MFPHTPKLYVNQLASQKPPKIDKEKSARKNPGTRFFIGALFVYVYFILLI
jgi:hypothetical protein